MVNYKIKINKNIKKKKKKETMKWINNGNLNFTKRNDRLHRNNIKKLKY